MDRRVTLRRLLAAAGLLLASAALLTCSNPFNLKEVLETEVKIATDKFLVVQSVTPVLNSTNVNPGVDVAIVFDRDLDEDTISEASVALTPPDASFTVEYEFIGSTNTLYVKGEPYLLDNTNYSITIGQGLQGADGSALQEEYTWSFTTGEYPAGSVKINNDAEATNTKNVTLNFTYKPVVDKYRFSLSSEADCLGSSTWYTGNSQGVTLPDSDSLDGVETVWVQFWGEVDGTDVGSSVETDTILLDRTPPAVGSFRINNGAVSTTSTSVTLNNSVSDLSSLQMRFQNGTSAGGSWEAYAATKAWTLASNIGTRAVTAEFLDAAGNGTTVAADYIIYGTPVLSSASLGSATVGTVTVNFTAGTEDAGTDYYYVYRRDYPDGEKLTYLGNGTSASSVNVPVTEGQLYYFLVRIYNSLAGGYGSYSATSALGYTSDVAIIYNDENGTDTTYASSLKTILTTNWASGYPDYVYLYGSLPGWSVTLIPQSLVSSTYSAANTFYGDPVIITHGNTLYSSATKTRNVIAHGHGVFAMGSGGARLLDTCETNWSSWGYGGEQAPNEIGYGESMYCDTASTYTMTAPAAESVIAQYRWYTPYSMDLLPGVDFGSADYIPNWDAAARISYGALTRYAVYRAGGASPTGGYLFAQDYEYSVYYDVISQDRFMQYGFTTLPTNAALRFFYGYQVGFPLLNNFVYYLRLYY